MSEYVYVTQEGLEKLKAELHELKTVRKREVANRIEKAKELGDLSENAEYADAKDEMSFIEGRIIELEDTVNRAKIIEAGGTDAVSIGCTVEIEGGGQKKTYTIVGSSEADPSAGRISNETPLARALLGKKVGDAITVTLPSGAVTYTVKHIS